MHVWCGVLFYHVGACGVCSVHACIIVLCVWLCYVTHMVCVVVCVCVYVCTMG